VSARRKDVSELRSQRWFGKHDLRSFGHRSRTKGEGFAAEDFTGKPVIAILNTWSDANPCHAHFRMRAEEVKRGVWQAGGFPLEMPVLSVGETFMKPSPMLYRNLLAMDAEELLRANPVDGAVLLGGCDKTIPGLLMGATSMNLPAIVVPAGPMLRGNWRGEFLASGTDVWKYWAEKRAGRLDDCAWSEMEDGIARSFGTCMTMGTASTMAAAAEALGALLPGASSIPAADSGHARMASAAGRRIVEMVFEDLKPRDVFTADAFDNAVTVAMALGGSTNAIIHLIAMAGRAGVPLDLDRFDALSRRTPFLANLRPSGEFLMEDFFYAGGLRALMARLLDLLHTDARTVNGRTVRENAEGATVFNEAVIASRERPLGPEGGLAVLRGNLAPNGAVIKHTAMEKRFLKHAGKAIVFRDYNDLAARIDDPALPARPAERGTPRRAGDAGVGHAPHPEEAAREGCPRHDADLRRAHERHVLRRVRAARGPRVVRGRAPRTREGRGLDRARRAGAAPDAAGRRRRARGAPGRVEAARVPAPSGVRRALRTPRDAGRPGLRLRLPRRHGPGARARDPLRAQWPGASRSSAQRWRASSRFR
jgi:dihydroxyacid dehydratase/phosphogluconate dehydratase